MLSAATKQWLHTTAYSQYWRIAPWYDINDLVQDGYVVWARVKVKYPNAEPKQLLRLFQRSYLNHIHDLSKRQSQDIDPLPIEEALLAGTPCDYADMLRVIVEAPTLVRKALIALISERFLDHRLRSDRTRETTNEYFCRLIGADPANVNLHEMTLTYLHRK